MAENLFDAAATRVLSTRAPLAARLRPNRLDDMVGQEHLLGPGKPLRVLIEQDRLSSILLWGPPGTGKTTLARAMSGHSSKAFVQLSAVTATVKDVRETISAATLRLGAAGQGTILFLDEIHRFNKAQQDALLPAVEDGSLILVGATTENPYFEVNAPLRSRSSLFRLELLGLDALGQLLGKGLAAEGVDADPEAIDHIAGFSNGDGRTALTALEVAIALARGREPESVRVILADAEAALGVNALRYGRDEHYDVISAFIKSIRGSDPDAGLYWLACMLEAGEDARFIARRMVILASEDVGMADPMSLLVADAAARAVEFVGLPEANLSLAQAVVHLAQAPKSNRVAQGIWDAQADVRNEPAGEVPVHLRDSHYQGAKVLGHGNGYRYPHDSPGGWVEQDYLPASRAGTRYYIPSELGFEADVRRRLQERDSRTSL